MLRRSTTNQEITMESLTPERPNARETWNKGKRVGQKSPLKLKDIWAIRIRLQLAARRVAPNTQVGGVIDHVGQQIELRRVAFGDRRRRFRAVEQCRVRLLGHLSVSVRHTYASRDGL